MRASTGQRRDTDASPILSKARCAKFSVKFGDLQTANNLPTIGADNRQAGRDRPELAPNLRSFPVGNYVIFYIPGSHGIKVLRVLNARQDISTEDSDCSNHRQILSSTE
ncbi:hypothetical protein V1281_000066 [Nitrobacteraceae bacterium AZCC 2161]